MKEIKVRLYAHENDSYNELYKVLSGDVKPKYFARHTYGGGVWYFVSDPMGYCELDHVCPDDYIFVVCDSNGDELFKDSNGEVSHPFPTLEKQCKITWQSIKEKYPVTEGLRDWLESFLTKEIKETTLKNEYCVRENWFYFWHDEIEKEAISNFGHLGDRYCIYKVTVKHRYCGCEWTEYYAGSETMWEYPGYICHFGSWFNNGVVGACYGEKEAVNLVTEALKGIYTKSSYSLSRVNEVCGMAYERRMNFRRAAEVLIGGNYDREHISSIIKTEKSNRSFYDSSVDMKKDYPNIKIDYNTK